MLIAIIEVGMGIVVTLPDMKTIVSFQHPYIK